MKRKKSTPQRQRPSVTVKTGVWNRTHLLIVAITSFLLYANTFGHSFAQDDAIVITDNMYTQKGLQGIPGLLTKDTFFGFFKIEGKEKLVSGGRYRPLTPVMFSVEHAIFGENAPARHIINGLLYALLCVMIYLLIIKIFKPIIAHEKLALFAFIATMLYAFHPIHTEAVANIKGRDEIMAMLLGCSSVLLLLRSRGNKILNGVFAGLVFFLAMMSKENAITLIPIAFLIYFLIRSEKVGKSIIKTIPLVAGCLVFLIIRFSILGFDAIEEPLEMMNNPFVKFENGSYAFFTTAERAAAILFAMGWYVWLLIFPHPLTNDYYPRQVGVMDLSDPLVLLSAAVLLVVTIAGFWFWKKNKVISFSVFYFLIAISIFSNVLFPIGTHLSERFLFMPSLGFCLLMAYVMWNIYYKFGSYVFYGLFLVVLGLYGLKTVTRNMDWKDDYTLYTTDVKVSNNSAKALNAAGGVLVSGSVDIKDAAEKQKVLVQSEEYLNKALTIHPNYKNAWLLLGNSRFYQKKYAGSIEALESALRIDPGFQDAYGNLATVLREAGRHAGEVEQNITKAKNLLQRSLEMNKNDFETNRMMGIAHSVSGEHAEAVKYYKEVIRLVPQDKAGYVLLSQAYSQLGDEVNAQLNRNKALQIDPNAFK
jgi:tetratricopeptide (TPR) repeat protein